MEAIMIILIIFGSIASLFILPRYFKSIERQKMAETLRIAIEKGQPLPTEVIEAMSSNVRSPSVSPSPQRDLRTGVLWLVVGLAFTALGFTMQFEEPEVLYPMLGVAAFPTFIGLAFIGLGLLGKKS